MKRFLGVLFLMILTSVVLTGCARSQKVIAVEEGVDLPYDSLGTLEVSQRIQNHDAGFIGGHLVELFSFRLTKAADHNQLYKAALMEKLAHEAKEKYGADRVINVEFWPALDSESFPRSGTVFARGEMIRLREFAA